MMPIPVHICSFTTLDDIPKKKRGDDIEVGRVLARAGRFSCFDLDESTRLASAVMRLGRIGWFEFDPNAEGYPWTLATVTPEGRAALGLETP